jgi:hypothetical protein
MVLTYFHLPITVECSFFVFNMVNQYAVAAMGYGSGLLMAAATAGTAYAFTEKPGKEKIEVYCL